ncbi:ABC transporter ATP-binding protein, partial [Streptomyces sp. SID11233]|nr:ABC transporter ATP-binding protein [Streptomyces sp. SID11233]
MTDTRETAGVPPVVAFDGVTKSYGEVRAVRGLSLV